MEPFDRRIHVEPKMSAFWCAIRRLVYGYVVAPGVDYAWIKEPILDKGIERFRRQLEASVPKAEVSIVVTRDNIDQWCDDQFFSPGKPPSKSRRWRWLNRWVDFARHEPIRIDTNCGSLPDRHVRITLHRRGGAIEFCFRDAGPPLTVEQLNSGNVEKHRRGVATAAEK